MFKLLDKLLDKLDKKWLTVGQLLCILAISAVTILLIMNMLIHTLSNFLIKFAYFNTFSKVDLEEIIACILFTLFGLFTVSHLLHMQKQYREARKRLAHRQLSDYVEKYKYYVDLVQRLSQKQEYQTLSLEEEWVKHFDRNLTRTSHLLNFNVPYSDFEIAACLMYALTVKEYNATSIRLAFECAKEILSNPKLYFRSFLDGNELQLTAQEYLESVDLSIIDPDVPEEAKLAIISTYLLEREDITILQLADFLKFLATRQKTAHFLSFHALHQDKLP